MHEPCCWNLFPEPSSLVSGSCVPQHRLVCAGVSALAMEAAKAAGTLRWTRDEDLNKHPVLLFGGHCAGARRSRDLLPHSGLSLGPPPAAAGKGGVVTRLARAEEQRFEAKALAAVGSRRKSVPLPPPGPITLPSAEP